MNLSDLTIKDVEHIGKIISNGCEGEMNAGFNDGMTEEEFLVAESILKDYYLEQTYQGFFDYTSFYDMYELNEATKAYEASKNQTEQS